MHLSDVLGHFHCSNKVKKKKVSSHFYRQRHVMCHSSAGAPLKLPAVLGLSSDSQVLH